MTAIATDTPFGAIGAMRGACDLVTVAIAVEFEERLACDDLLQAMTDSLIGQPDPSKKQKADGSYQEHSATSAEKAAKQSPEYRAAQRRVLECEVKRIRAWSEYEAAKLRARLAVAAEEGRA